MMQISDLLYGYSIFGNKGAVWSKKCHIQRNGEPETLCGVPMLSNNWARIEEVKEIGCEDCIVQYRKSTHVPHLVDKSNVKTEATKFNAYVKYTVEFKVFCRGASLPSKGVEKACQNYLSRRRDFDATTFDPPYHERQAVRDGVLEHNWIIIDYKLLCPECQCEDEEYLAFCARACEGICPNEGDCSP